MCALASLYVQGQGVAQSFEKTAELYTLAANQGHADGQVNLGSAYYNGKGVAQSNAMARKWWLKAALQEQEIAIKNLKILDEQEGKTTPTLPCCATCGTPKTTRRPLNNCSGCRTVHYCNRDCQMKHWKEGHKRKCKQLKATATALVVDVVVAVVVGVVATIVVVAVVGVVAVVSCASFAPPLSPPASSLLVSFSFFFLDNDAFFSASAAAFNRLHFLLCPSFQCFIWHSRLQ
jgi:hypothetical protein